MATNTSKIQTMCHHYSPAYMNEVFRLAENIRISTRNSYFKLSHPFRKTSAGQNSLSYIVPVIWTEFQKFWRKPKIWVLSNIRWNTTIWMIFLIQIYELCFGYHKEYFSFHWTNISTSCFCCCFFLLHSDWGITMKIRLFACFVLSLPYYFFFSLILLLTSTFFVCCKLFYSLVI